MTDRLWITFFGVAGVIAIIVGFIGLPVKKMPALTSEQIEAKFQVELTETNRQSDVAAQLRSAERGYLMEYVDGRINWILTIDRTRLWVSYADQTSGFANDSFVELTKHVKRVVGPNDADWGKISYTFLSGERTK